jgi:hypothetical protein
MSFAALIQSRGSVSIPRSVNASTVVLNIRIVVADQHSGRRFGSNVAHLQSRSTPVEREAEDKIDDGSVNGSAGLQSPTRVLCVL